MLKNIYKKFILIVCILFVLCISSQPAFAWNGTGHDAITDAALDYIYSDWYLEVVWENFLDDAGKDEEWFKDVVHPFADYAWPDDVSNKQDAGRYVTAKLDNEFNNYITGLNIWGETRDGNSVRHTDGTIHVKLNDPEHKSIILEPMQIHNAIALYQIAEYCRDEQDDYDRALQVLGLGVHYVEDYFAHFRSGISDTGDHGIPCMDPDDKNVDKINWDNHDTATGGVKSNCSLYVPQLWHYHSNVNDCWRYRAAKYTTALYIEAFLRDNLSLFTAALDSGYVYDFDNSEQLLIAHQTRLVVDNTTDDATPGFVYCYGTTWSSSSNCSGFYGSNYYYSRSTPDDTLFEWVPILPATGTYRIYMRWAPLSNRPDHAKVTITHSGGTTTTYVNQKTSPETWNYLGEYEITDDSHGIVRIYNNDTGNTIADAVLYRYMD